MNPVVGIIIAVIGFIAGLIVGIGLKFLHLKSTKEIAERLVQDNELKNKENLDGILNHLKAAFGDLSLQALSRSTDEFLKLASQKLGSEREINVKELAGTKSLIDQQLGKMNSELEKVEKLVVDLDKDRENKFGELSRHLKTTGEQTAMLLQTTNSLREALASNQVRGQWGERMAEDVLRLSGLVEGINYLKQKTLEIGSRPDFTFLLPKDLKLNMDVKFPLPNFVKYLEATSDLEREGFRGKFLRDVKEKVKQVAGREYINPDQSTVDYVILFIPNEQIYTFIHEQDSSIIDEGIKSRVIFCSPVTLFAVLSVIRQAIDNFAMERTSKETLSILGDFHKQWREFIKKFDGLGKHIEAIKEDFDALTTTRRRALEKPLERIESLRTDQGMIEENEVEETLPGPDSP